MSIFLAVLAWIGIVLAIVLMIAAVVACLVGIPGAWVVFVITCVLSISTGWDRPPWWMLIPFLIMTIAAEAGDNLLSAWGTKKYGGTTKAAFWAMVGGLTGVIIGGQLCTSVLSLLGPFGTIAGATVGTLTCGMAGGYLGGYWYELRQGKPKKEAQRAGWGAFLGRGAGGILKAALAAIMVTLTIWSLLGNGGPMAGRDDAERAPVSETEGFEGESSEVETPTTEEPHQGVDDDADSPVDGAARAPREGDGHGERMVQALHDVWLGMERPRALRDGLQATGRGLPGVL